MLRLGQDMGLPQEERGVRLGEGSVHLAKGVCVGEGMFA